MRENTGKVVLVGAGPGDTGLLTLKGEKYIKQADCLVYDRLSSPEFLSMAKAGCELIYVGKENHKHVMKQDAINELLSSKSLYTPSTSVKKASFSAFTALAMAQAASSALML